MSDLSQLAEGLKVLRGGEDSSLQPNRTVTARQKQAIENLVENGGNKAEALRAAGYSEAVVNSPQKVFASPYVKKLMEEVGLTESAALTAVKRNLSAKSERVQLTAADMVFKLAGSYAPTRVEGKHDHRVGIFSYSELRKKQQREGIQIVGVIPTTDKTVL